jgi:hypothetical protein
MHYGCLFLQLLEASPAIAILWKVLALSPGLPRLQDYCWLLAGTQLDFLDLIGVFESIHEGLDHRLLLIFTQLLPIIRLFLLLCLPGQRHEHLVLLAAFHDLLDAHLLLCAEFLLGRWRKSRFSGV